jgi:hypothetical protein
MLKTASSMAILLLAGSVVPAFAADCLQQVDSLTVQYDLPAGEGMAGTQTGSYPDQPPLPAPETGAAPRGGRLTPPGRPGMAALSGGEVLRPAQGLPINNELSKEQRARMQTLLHDARAADAMEDEAKCQNLLRQAQGIPAKKG